MCTAALKYISNTAAFKHLSFNLQLPFQSSNMSPEIAVQSNLNNQNQYYPVLVLSLQNQY